MLTLRPYQTDCLRKIEEEEQAGVRSQLVALPTGTGKTIVFASLIKERGGRALILAHRDELIRQAVDKLEMVAPELKDEIGIVKAERDETEKRVVVASVQTVTQPKRLEQLGTFPLVVVDEAHHAVAPSYRRVIDGTWGSWNGPSLLLGFTATPERADRKSLRDVFDKIIYRKSLLEMVGAGYLCDLRSKRVLLRDLHLADVKMRGQDFDDGALGYALEEARAPEYVAQAVGELAQGRKALVFLPTVATAEATRTELAAIGIRSAMVHGGDRLEDRRRRLGEFAEGKWQAMTNCAVLLEGYDEPSVDCIVVARPTYSRVMYQQMIGRGTRPYFGKRDCLILDLVGAEATAGLQTFESLFHLRPETAEKGLLELLRTVHAQKEAGRRVGVQIEVVERSRLSWVEDPQPEGIPSRWLLSCGEETLTLARLDERWAVRAYPRDRNAPPRLLFRDLTLDYAQGVAEDYVRAAGAWGLVDPAAGWRHAPASERQLQLLQKMRVPHHEGISKGEASDLLSRRFMKHR
jgi:superfamily II DNA or RNA helicase